MIVMMMPMIFLFFLYPRNLLNGQVFIVYASSKEWHAWTIVFLKRPASSTGILSSTVMRYNTPEGRRNNWAICSTDPPRVFRAHRPGGFNAILPLRYRELERTED
jgi:hypothetical protein